MLMTSRAQIPALHKRLVEMDVLRPGTINFDLGGGRFENASEWLAARGVQNVIYDPYARDPEWNSEAMAFVRSVGGCDTATLANVLNVIPERSERNKAIRAAARAIKKDGAVFFLSYEGDRSGITRQTRDGWQLNLPTEEYDPEIQRHFGEIVPLPHKILMALGPRR